MENFSDLLNQYIQRAGISDAELSRAIGVSRQTIFRWREGATARPRYREDVLAIAQKLRLSPAERDQLLLAAGFRPEEPETPESPTLEKIEPQAEKVEPAPAPATGRRRWPAAAIVVILLLVIGMASWWLYQTNSRQSSIVPASPGETLVLVTRFANYASSQVGYNIAGRLTDTLQQEIDQAELKNIRVAEWPHVVSARPQAVQVGQSISATLVIYGEYDVGRIIVQFANPVDQSAFTDPALQQYVAGIPELSATVNSNLPRQVRPLALMALGQTYLNQGNPEQARSLLGRARDGLQAVPDVDDETWAMVNFYLGLAWHHSRPPLLDAAINAYTESINAWPSMLSSRVNRSAALISRAQPGDWEQALLDMDVVVNAKQDWPLAYSNRASILINLGGEENLETALADLTKALDLDPNLPGAYLHRAYLTYRRGQPLENYVPDLEKTLTLRQDDTSALNLLCWGYAVEGQPEQALPYCEQLVEIDPAPYFRDSRGLTYALLGNTTAAIIDFQTSADWMAQQENEVWVEPLARREAWLAALRDGENPFPPEVLAEIRYEFGK
jgi:tetratricopeptide (TPR) repeat protein